jgi:hypothetical protein
VIKRIWPSMNQNRVTIHSISSTTSNHTPEVERNN